MIEQQEYTLLITHNDALADAVKRGLKKSLLRMQFLLGVLALDDLLFQFYIGCDCPPLPLASDNRENNR